MPQVRTIVTVIIVALIIYAFLPAEKKRKIKGKVGQLWLALSVSVLIYWVFTLGVLLLHYIRK